MTKTIHQPRRWFQFGIKSLMVWMLLVAVFFGGRMSLHRELQSVRDRLEQIENERAMKIRAEQQALQLRQIDAGMKADELERRRR